MRTLEQIRADRKSGVKASNNVDAPITNRIVDKAQRVSSNMCDRWTVFNEKRVELAKVRIEAGYRW
jgi:hypothetical protein